MGDKDKKYDRQLRLWGNHGQQALENSRICLINVTATGTETLKNLVLPGVGSFVIIDNTRITAEDAGSNFFLDLDCVGESKSKIATQMLLELNPDVKGEYVEEDARNLIANNLQYFLNFSVVLVCGLPSEAIRKLASFLWEANISLFLCISYGFVGYLRLAVKEHCVVESHPDNTHEDLRLDVPFPELTDYVDSIDLNSMSKKDHSHTPYLLILLKILERWKNTHSGAMPKTYKDKKEFKEVIRAAIRKNENGIPEEEENFDEALKQVNSSLVQSIVSHEVKTILDDPKCIHLTEESSNFWLLANGLRKFVENDKCNLLPLRGSLPDMFSDSERYIKLQNIYQDKAKRDMETLTNYVSETCSHLGCGNGRLLDRDVKRFCRNAHFLRVIRTRSIENEYSAPSEAVINSLSSEENSDAIWYVMLRLVEQFSNTNGKYPGLKHEDLESDMSKLKHFLSELMRSWGIPGATEAISDDFIHEICRCGAAEIHSVASYMGGVAAHEIIKVITTQYVPINNSYIYNGMKSTSVMLEV